MHVTIAPLGFVAALVCMPTGDPCSGVNKLTLSLGFVKVVVSCMNTLAPDSSARVPAASNPCAKCKLHGERGGSARGSDKR